MALSVCGQTKREDSVSESIASIVRNQESEKKDAADSSKEKEEKPEKMKA